MLGRLGPHILERTGAALDWAKVAPIVKQAFGHGVLTEARADAITICRPIWKLTTDGAAAAQQVINALASYRPTYVELWNESDEMGQRLGSGLENRVEQTRIATAILHNAGIRVAGFTFSTGNPGVGFTNDTPDCEYLRAHGYAGVDAIAFHCYFGNNGFTAGHALRYRRAHAIMGSGHPPFVITECGRDRIEGAGGGWQLDNIPPERYLYELRCYDSQLAQDSYVLGATPFTSGPTPDWWAYDVDPITEALIRASPLRHAHQPIPYPPGTCHSGSTWALALGLVALEASLVVSDNKKARL